MIIKMKPKAQQFSSQVRRPCRVMLEEAVVVRAQWMAIVHACPMHYFMRPPLGRSARWMSCEGVSQSL